MRCVRLDCCAGVGLCVLVSFALLRARALPGADDWTELKPEYSIPPALTGDASHKTRVDFMLTGGITHYLEVKNCHLVAEDGWGYFPDSVSDRAAKHVGCLAQLAERGYRATVLLCVQRSDCRFDVRAQARRARRRARSCSQLGFTAAISSVRRELCTTSLSW